MLYGTENPSLFSANKNIPPQNLKKIYRTFCWCSGARIHLLNSCPTDFNKFFGIGIIVCLTGLMASISGGYALFTVFDNIVTAIIFGLLWGVLIFFIDWYIVSSLRKENKIKKELLTASPRILLAIMISVIISKPLELKLFQKEIDQQIENLKRDKENTYLQKVDKNFAELLVLQQNNKQLQDEINTLTETRSKLYDSIIAEAEGRSVTNKIGKGPVFKEKRTEFDQIDGDLRELRIKNANLIFENNSRIKELKKNRDQQVVKGNVLTENYNGFLARLEAFGQLCQQNKTINITNWFIILLFIIIETCPMIVKLISDRGVYDELFELEEQRQIAEISGHRRNIRIEFENKFELSDYISKMKQDSAREVNKKFIDDVTEANNEINSLKVKKWKTNEYSFSESDTKKFIEPVNTVFEDSSKDITQDNYVI